MQVGKAPASSPGVRRMDNVYAEPGRWGMPTVCSLPPSRCGLTSVFELKNPLLGTHNSSLELGGKGAAVVGGKGPQGLLW